MVDKATNGTRKTGLNSGLDKKLETLSKSELIKIVRSLIKMQPKLKETVIHLVDAAQADTTSDTTYVHAPVYKERAYNIIHSLDHMRRSEAYWMVADVTEELDEIIDEVRGYLFSGESKNAYIILHALTETFVVESMELDDSNGEIGSFYERLDRAWTEVILASTMNEQEASDLLEEVDSWRDEVSDYMDGAFDVALLALQQGPTDYTLQQILAQNAVDPLYDVEVEDAYTNDLLTRVRLDILARQQRYDDYIQLASFYKMYELMAIALLEQGRVDETFTVGITQLDDARKAYNVAEALYEAGYIEKALAVGERGLQLVGPKVFLGDWLAKNAVLVNSELAKEGALIAFQHDVHFERYKVVLELHKPDASVIKDNMLQFLRASKDTMNVQEKVTIFLHEKLFDDAITVIDTEKYWYDGAIEKVVSAVYNYNPTWTIKRALKSAMSIIDGGQAPYYDNAIGWLTWVKKAYEVQGDSSGWQACIADIKQKHKPKYKLMGLLQKLEEKKRI